MSKNASILHVSELTQKVRFMLESELNTIWLCGEISNFISASSGHWYLSLKDKKSQVRCAMFKGNNRRVRISPQNGQQILVKAKVSLYEPRGDFQLIIEQMEDAGEGLLRQKFEQLKQKLNSEGYFSLNHKKTLPTNIQRIGVVTSPTGAAIQDIISVIQRRNPYLQLTIYPCLVQGDQAAYDIVDAIHTANKRKECDVLIVGRGGGSIEDLWSFNEEMVVQAIFDSELPIISAVGHEIDTTLADFTADLRAPTPSAAAELVSTESEYFIERISALYNRVTLITQDKLAQKKQKLEHLQHRLKMMHPAQLLGMQMQNFDEYQQRIKQNIHITLKSNRNKHALLSQRLISQSPLISIQSQQQKIQQLKVRLIKQIQQIVHEKQSQFQYSVEALHLISPLATIARGYSVIRNNKGEIIKSTNQLTHDEKVNIQLHESHVEARIIKQ